MLEQDENLANIDIDIRIRDFRSVGTSDPSISQATDALEDISTISPFIPKQDLNGSPAKSEIIWCNL